MCAKVTREIYTFKVHLITPHGKILDGGVLETVMVPYSTLKVCWQVEECREPEKSLRSTLLSPLISSRTVIRLPLRLSCIARNKGLVATARDQYVLGTTRRKWL
jgi:hypothetical protein